MAALKATRFAISAKATTSHGNKLWQRESKNISILGRKAPSFRCLVLRARCMDEHIAFETDPKTIEPLKPVNSEGFDSTAEDLGSMSSLTETSNVDIMEDNSILARPSSVTAGKHPWLEWSNFIALLNSQGYISLESRVERDGSPAIRSSSGELKRAVIDFGRDRDDIFELLNAEGMADVFRFGCPNIDRKVVNASKRLRQHLGIAESDACGQCEFKANCERAFATPIGVDSSTVEVVRVLMAFAKEVTREDSKVKETSQSASFLHDKVSVACRHLLSEVVNYASTPRDPSKPKKEYFSSRNEGIVKPKAIRPETPPRKWLSGDWACSKCNFNNFARNTECKSCRSAKTESDGSGEGRELPYQPSVVSPERMAPRQQDGSMHTHRGWSGDHERRGGARDRGISSDHAVLKGDWECVQCGFNNFARNASCKRCSASKRGASSQSDDSLRRQSDWDCPKCSFVNFERNQSCKRCGEGRASPKLQGDWDCTSCDFMNFAKNRVCRKCGQDRPAGNDRGGSFTRSPSRAAHIGAEPAGWRSAQGSADGWGELASPTRSPYQREAGSSSSHSEARRKKPFAVWTPEIDPVNADQFEDEQGPRELGRVSASDSRSTPSFRRGEQDQGVRHVKYDENLPSGKQTWRKTQGKGVRDFWEEYAEGDFKSET